MGLSDIETLITAYNPGLEHVRSIRAKHFFCEVTFRPVTGHCPLHIKAAKVGKVGKQSGV